MNYQEQIEHYKQKKLIKSTKTREAHKRGVWTLKELCKTAEEIHSLYVRLRDANKDWMIQCCTCPAIKPIKEMECGHFKSRTILPLKFCEENCHGQCHGCNDKRYGNGKVPEHEAWIAEKHGIEKLHGLTDVVIMYQSGKINVGPLELFYRNLIPVFRDKALKEAERIGYAVLNEYKGLFSKIDRILSIV